MPLDNPLGSTGSSGSSSRARRCSRSEHRDALTADRGAARHRARLARRPSAHHRRARPRRSMRPGIDPLLGIWNRVAMAAAGDRCTSRRRSASGLPLTAVAHRRRRSRGDQQALRPRASAIACCAGSPMRCAPTSAAEDVVGRWSGDKIAVLLPRHRARWRRSASPSGFAAALDARAARATDRRARSRSR